MTFAAAMWRSIATTPMEAFATQYDVRVQLGLSINMSTTSTPSCGQWLTLSTCYFAALVAAGGYRDAKKSRLAAIGAVKEASAALDATKKAHTDLTAKVQQMDQVHTH
jgi:hypothetical protein